jgi:hypothetical protein
MSRLILSLAVLGLAAGCAPSAGPLSVQGIFAPSTGCKLPAATDPMIPGGSLDYSATAANPLVTPAFYVGLILQADVAVAGNGGELNVGGTALEASGRDLPVLDQMVRTYSSAPKLPIKDSTLPLTAIFPGQGTNILTLSFSGVDLLSTGAGSVADAIANSAAGGTYALTVNTDFRGHMSRSGSKISTGFVSFPIELYQSTATCQVPKVPTACLAGGQDGTPACCDPVLGVTPTGCP